MLHREILQVQDKYINMTSKIINMYKFLGKLMAMAITWDFDESHGKLHQYDK